MIRVPTDRTPTRPGDMLLEEFLVPLGMTAGFWMNLQLRWDLFFVQQTEGAMLAEIEPYDTASIA